MRYRLKISILSIAFFVAAALTIFALAEIIRPLPTDPYKAHAELTKPITGSVNEALEATFTLGNPDSDMHASISLDTSNRNSIIGTLNLPGTLERIFLDEEKELAYLANSYSGLHIVDISDPAHLQLRSSLQLPGLAWDIQIRNDVLFLASATQGLHLIDISSPENPSIISQLNVDNYSILKIVVSNNTVYAMTGGKGLLVIDISDINAPQLVNTLYAGTGAWGLLADKNRLYVSCGKSRLDVLDISQPKHPIQIASLATPDKSWDMKIHGSVLYLPTQKAGLLLVDTSNPLKPERIKSQLQLVGPDSVFINNDRAYVSSRTGQMSILDLSIPRRPKLIGTFDIPYRPRSLAVSGQTTYMASGFDGLHTLKTDTLVSSEQTQSLRTAGFLSQVIIDSDYFFITRNGIGLSVAQRDASGAPGAVVATLPLSSSVSKMVRTGDYLFLACARAGLKIINISDPASPTIVDNPDFAVNTLDIVAIKNRLFLADYNLGLQVVDISSAEQPRLIETFPLAQLARLSSDARYIYAATTQADLHILDYSSRVALKQVGTLSLPWPLKEFASVKRLAVSGKTVYMAARAAELISVDISDPTSPELREIINLDGEPQSVTVDGNKVYVSTREGKLYVLHKNDDEKLHRHAVIDSLGKGHDLIVDGDRMIIANGVKGLTLLPLPKQVDIINWSKSAGRSGSTASIKVRIPPQSIAGIYNLTLFNRDEQVDFDSAVTLSQASD